VARIGNFYHCDGPSIRKHKIGWVGLLSHRNARMEIGQIKSPCSHIQMSKTKLSKEGSLSCQTNRMTSFSGNEVCNNAINNLLSTFQMAELFSI